MDDNHLEFRVTVPFGCQADVTLPYAPESLHMGEYGILLIPVQALRRT